MSMTAKERAEQLMARYGTLEDLPYGEEIRNDLVSEIATALRAHANTALEAAAKVVCPFCAHGKPLVHDPEIGWLHQYPDDPESDSSCYAAAIRAMREPDVTEEE